MAYPGRTNEGLMEAIVEVDSDAWPDLSPFIDVANSMVTECCATFPDGTVVPDNKLLLVETWLSAHFYSVVDPRTTQEHAGSVGEHYETKIDLALNLTRYGQMAMIIDTTGGLARRNNIIQTEKLGVVSITYLGTPSPRLRFLECVDIEV